MDMSAAPGHDGELPLSRKNGIDVVDPFCQDPTLKGKYLVRHYNIPDPQSLEQSLELLRSFERRLLQFVNRGYAVTDKDDVKLSQLITNRQQLIDNPSAPVDLNAPQNAVLAEEYRTALLGRALRNAKKHIRLRIEELHPDKERLNDLYRQIGQDFARARNLPFMNADGELVTDAPTLPPLRGKRGYRDIDGVIEEMIGEPFNIYMASLDGNNDAIKGFYNNRYNKTAKAMKSIDEASSSVSKIIEKYPAFVPFFSAMQEAAKERVQVRAGFPEYGIADTSYIGSRNMLHDLISEQENKISQLVKSTCLTSVGQKDARKPRHESSAIIQASKENNDLRSIKSAVDIIYNIVVTHIEKPKEIELLKAQIYLADIAQQQSRSR